MLQAVCLFGPPLLNPSIAIHSLPPCLCLSVSCTVLILADGQRHVVGDQCYEYMNYESSWTTTKKHTDHSFLNIPPCCDSSLHYSLSALSSYLHFFLLLSCPFPCVAALVCFKLDESWPWCIQTFVIVGEEEERRGDIVSALWSRSEIVDFCVTRWVMTKHFILVQWVRYSNQRAVMMTDDNTRGVFLWYEHHHTKKGLCWSVCKDEWR